MVRLAVTEEASYHTGRYGMGRQLSRYMSKLDSTTYSKIILREKLEKFPIISRVSAQATSADV